MLRRAKALRDQILGKKPGPEVVYSIGDFKLNLPKDHALPAYQAAHRLYDRFLLGFGPINLDGWIIDVGANVGDSAAAMASGTPKKIVCVEPSGEFSPYLRRNAEAIRSRGSTVEISTFALSAQAREITLGTRAGTASRSKQGETAKAITLDELVVHLCPSAKIALIKCDVDGFDADVLMSGLSVIDRDAPALYFECDLQSGDETGTYVSLAECLFDKGYSIACFDNFGLPLLDLQTAGQMRDLIDYLMLQRIGASTRTFYYVDCFAFTKANPVFSQVLSTYRQGLSRL